MAKSKTKLFNQSLNVLLLVGEIENSETDKSKYAKVLRQNYEFALEHVLADLDLDSTISKVTLELLATLGTATDEWEFVYKYPTNCARFRRIVSGHRMDRKSTHIPKEVSNYEGAKAIYTDEANAIAEIIPEEFDLDILSSSAFLALAHYLAYMATPLVVGKGAKTLRKQIMEDYNMYKIEAQQKDKDENFTYDEPYEVSEFVEVRMS